MRKVTLFIFVFYFLVLEVNSQSSPVHHNVQDNATVAVERIAKFSVSDALSDVLEIVNGTQVNGQFVPNIWAHRSSDNRIAFNIFTSIKSNVDNGSNPIMTFRAELRNSIYDSYPYPWGSQVAQVQNRPLFSWSNYNSTKMLMKANGNLGLGTTNPTAQLHTTSTLRFQNLGLGTSNYVLVVDGVGNVKRKYMNNSGGGGLCDCPFLKSIPNSSLKFKRNVKVIDNSLSKILQLTGREYSWRTDEYESKNFNTKKELGFIAEEVEKIIPELVSVDNDGDKNLDYLGMIPLLLEAVKEQQNQITLLQNKISDLELNNEENNFSNINSTRTSFSSNYPNPFGNETKVDFYIENNIKNARLVIYNMNGTTVKSINLKQRGIKTNISINKQGLKSGIYFYTLIADDVVIGTKKMLVK